MKIDEYNRNIILNYLFRFLAIMGGLLSTRLNLEYLGTNLYGMWVTIASIISWMNSGDFGIGNGLRNQLAIAYAEKDIEKQKSLISTSFKFLIRVIFVLFFIMFFGIELLLKYYIIQSELRIPLYITGIFFLFNLFLGLSQSIAYSYQKSWLVTLVNCVASYLLVICVWALLNFDVSANLLLFAFLHGICMTLPNVILILLLQHNTISIFGCLKLKINKDYIKLISNIGLQFFGLQICSLILFSTDNLIINYLFQSFNVTEYSIISKVYDTGNSIYSILMISLWSAVTYYLAKGDFIWIKKKIKSLIGVWAVYSFGVVIVSLLFNEIIMLWLGNSAPVFNNNLIILFAIYSIVTAFSSIFVNVINGLGKIKIQLMIGVITAILNIPLSIFFAKNCELGIFGVKFATLLCVSITAIVIPIQVIKILNSSN